MENSLVRTPILGTNQFKVKFGDKVKRKFKVRTATKVKIAVISLLIASLYINYVTIKDNYVFSCTGVVGGINQQWHLGHFESVNTCNQLTEDRLRNLGQ